MNNPNLEREKMEPSSLRVEGNSVSISQIALSSKNDTRDATPSAAIPQRQPDDCTICAIAMAAGLSYEQVMEAALVAPGGYRYGGTPGTMSPKSVLMELGFSVMRAGLEGDQGASARRLLWGRRAILSVPSLNGFSGHHDVYWDGHAVRDPSPGLRYPTHGVPGDAIWATVLDETRSATGASPEGLSVPQDEIETQTPTSIEGVDQGSSCANLGFDGLVAASVDALPVGKGEAA